MVGAVGSKAESNPAQGHLGLSEFFEARGEVAASMNELRQAVTLDPGYKDAWFRLGCMQLLYEGREKAVESLDLGLQGRNPQQAANLCNQIAMKFYSRSRHQEAVYLFRRAHELLPKDPLTVNALAWVLATSADEKVRNPEEALGLAESNSELSNQAVYYDTLAAAQAATGKMDDAIKSIKSAIALVTEKPDAPDNPQLKDLEDRLRHFESGLTIRKGDSR